MQRPTSSADIPRATEATIDPTVKAKREMRRQIGRPKISLMDAMIGMKTALVRRYDVPIQKPWVAVPPSSVVIFVKDVMMIDASNETIREMRDSDSMINSSWVEGFQSGSAVDSLSFSMSSVELLGKLDGV